MKTTIDLNGLRIEHDGGDSVLLISEAPTLIAIDDLIKELSSLGFGTEGEEEFHPLPRQSLCNLPVGLSRITELG